MIPSWLSASQPVSLSPHLAVSHPTWWSLIPPVIPHWPSVIPLGRLSPHLVFYLPTWPFLTPPGFYQPPDLPSHHLAFSYPTWPSSWPFLTPPGLLSPYLTFSHPTGLSHTIHHMAFPHPIWPSLPPSGLHPIWPSLTSPGLFSSHVAFSHFNWPPLTPPGCLSPPLASRLDVPRYMGKCPCAMFYPYLDELLIWRVNTRRWTFLCTVALLSYRRRKAKYLVNSFVQRS